MVDEVIDRVLFLKSTRPFAEVAPADLLDVAEHLQRRAYQPGDVLVVQGQPSHGIQLIAEGRVRVSQSRAGGAVPLLELGPGESVGELSALTGDVAATRCEAHTDVVAWLLPTEVLLRLLHQHPGVGVALLRVLSRRLVHTTGMVASRSAAAGGAAG